MTDQNPQVLPNTYYYLTQGLSGTECYISLSENSVTKLKQIGITRIIPNKDSGPTAAADYTYKLIIPNRHRKAFMSVMVQWGYIRDLRGLKEGNTIRLISMPKMVDDANSRNVNSRKKSKKISHGYDSDEMEDWVAANIRSRVIKNGVIKCDGCRTQITEGYWKIENNEEYFEDDGIDYYRICNQCTQNEGTWVSLK
jgi:hypothetical protein